MQRALRLRHFKKIQTEPSRDRPFLLFEVRLDYHDVRSGLTGCDSGTYSAPVLEETDLDWTPDLVVLQNRASLEEVPPRGSPEWPDGADGQVTRFFLKHFRRTAWKNSDLGLYSLPEETEREFAERCAELLAEERRSLVAQIRDLFLHRFLETEQRVLAMLNEEEWDVPAIETRRAEVRDVLTGFREQFNRCLLKEDWEPLKKEVLCWKRLHEVEAQERLETLRDEFLAQYNATTRRIRKRLREIEPYEVTLNHGEIEVNPLGFLWA